MKRKREGGLSTEEQEALIEKLKTYISTKYSPKVDWVKAQVEKIDIELLRPHIPALLYCTYVKHLTVSGPIQKLTHALCSTGCTKLEQDTKGFTYMHLYVRDHANNDPLRSERTLIRFTTSLDDKHPQDEKGNTFWHLALQHSNNYARVALTLREHAFLMNNNNESGFYYMCQCLIDPDVQDIIKAELSEKLDSFKKMAAERESEARDVLYAKIKMNDGTEQSLVEFVDENKEKLPPKVVEIFKELQEIFPPTQLHKPAWRP